MKEYKRNVLLTALSSLLSLAAIGVVLAIFLWLYPAWEKSIMLAILGLMAVLLLITLFTELKQKITIEEEHIAFKDFRLKNVRSFAFGSLNTTNSDKTIKEFNLDYSKINRIDAGRDILFWQYNIHLVTEEIPTPVVISSAMQNHKQLYKEIIENVKNANPSVQVDKKFNKYLINRKSEVG